MSHVMSQLPERVYANFEDKIYLRRGSVTVFGTAKRQLPDRLQNRIIVDDFREVTGTLRGCIFDM